MMDGGGFHGIYGSFVCNKHNNKQIYKLILMNRGTTSNQIYGSHYSAVGSFTINSRTLPISKTKPIGLQNLGNTSYISSVLQLLFIVLPDSTARSKGRVTDLIFKLKSTRNVRDYQALKAELQNSIEMVNWNHQQDAHEFLVQLLQLIDRESSGMSSRSMFEYKEKLELRSSQKNIGNEKNKMDNTTMDLFSVQIVNQLQCDRKHLKHRIQKYECLSVEFPSLCPASNLPIFYSSTTVHLKTLIQKMSEGEKIAGLKCEQCKTTDFEKRTFIYSLPDYLILHLSRFKQGHLGMGKVHSFVEYDEDLILDQRSDNAKCRYKLVGTVNHMGSLNRGHYYSQIRQSDGKWYEINDETVRQIKLERTGIISKQVYILFYQRQ